MKYEITQQGNQWIATDGNLIAEGDDPDMALGKLLLMRDDDNPEDCAASIDRARYECDLLDDLGRRLCVLLRLMATNSPKIMVMTYLAHLRFPARKLFCENSRNSWLGS